MNSGRGRRSGRYDSSEMKLAAVFALVAFGIQAQTINVREKARIRADNWRAVSLGDYGRLRTAENDAMLRMEIVWAELKRHKRNDH